MLKRLLLVFMLSLLLVGFKPLPVFSALDSCTASVSPVSMRPDTPYNLTFTVNNTSDTDILWVNIIRPSVNFSIDSSLGTGWGYDILPDSIDFHTLAEFHITPGTSKYFVFQSTSGSSEIPAQGWVVEVSGVSEGANPITCSGSTGVSISNSAAPSDLASAVLSDLVVNNITSSGATISFTTDKSAVGQIDYGQTIDYGVSAIRDDPVTSHSFDISGLNADTTYYYRVQVTDSINNVTTLEGNTFTTTKKITPVVTTPTPITNNYTIIVTITPTPTISVAPTPTPIPDSIAPTVSLDTDFSKPFKDVPKITGSARDDKNVAEVDYSTDNGKNWLPVDNIKSPGSTSTIFDFTPLLNDDGNYQIKARAKDNYGNIGMSSVYTLIIDRLPPQVGSVLFSLGPQVLVPNSDGTILALADLKHQITVSAVGGPIQIALSPQGSNDKKLMIKNEDNGLWSTGIQFAKVGNYNLNAFSVDGAGNNTVRLVTKLQVIKNGQVLSGGKGVKNASISLYYLDPQTRDFVLWDGSGYGEKNPQKTGDTGNYQYYLPAGQYYLLVKAANFRTLKTNIFTVKQVTPLTIDFHLEKPNTLGIGPFKFSFPDFTQTTAQVNIAGQQAVNQSIKSSFVGTQVPSLDVYGYQKVNLGSAFLGKPTIITIFNTWTPQTYSQIQALEDLTANNDINVAAIFPQESASVVSLYKLRGGYSLKMFADPDGTLVQALNLSNVPTHVFVTRKGIIRKIVGGVLSGPDLLNDLVN